jgi:translation initiation factor 4G
MFSALDMGEGSSSTPERNDGGEPQRKKLELAPRTKPIEDDQEADEGEEDEQDDQPQASAAMTADGAKAKIDSDMKELWGEKDAGGSRNPDDVVEYYQALPEEHRQLLSTRLAEDAFRISKMKDVEVVARSWEKALEEKAVTRQELIEG